MDLKQIFAVEWHDRKRLAHVQNRTAVQGQEVQEPMVAELLVELGALNIRSDILETPVETESTVKPPD